MCVCLCSERSDLFDFLIRFFYLSFPLFFYFVYSLCVHFANHRLIDADNLLADKLFKQNQMILSKALRIPICIDPQFSAMAYIRATHKHQHNFKILRFDMDNAMAQLKNAISTGETVVFENVNEYIDPSLSDLLEKKLTSLCLFKYACIATKLYFE